MLMPPGKLIGMMVLATTAFMQSSYVLSEPAIDAPTHVISPIESVDHVLWKNVPIHIVLPVGQERRIDFPVPVKIEWPDDVAKSTRNLQIRENGSIYWTAEKSFSKQRVNVFTFTGESYLLDVEASQIASPRPLVVIDRRFPDEKDLSNSDPDSVASVEMEMQYDSVDIVRMAAQYLYAPRRLVNLLPGVTRIPVETKDVRLYKGGALMTSPIAQWKAPGYTEPLYVTAVRVTSNSLHQVLLDPRNLRGDWISATPQHGMVNPAGEDGDTTAWYLVSTRPFAESLK